MTYSTFLKPVLLCLPFCLGLAQISHAQTATEDASPLAGIFDPKELGVGSSCRKEQRFFLRSQISGQSLIFCDLDAGDGASLSYTRNGVTDESDFTSKAGFGVRLGKVGKVGKATRAGFLGYAEIDNKTESTGQDEGQVRFGIDSNFRTDVGDPRAAPDAFSFRMAGSVVSTLGVYYLTDVNFDARGYGIAAAVHPEIPALRINFKTREQSFHWNFNAFVDALKLDEAGSTGLDDDTDYGWVGASLEAVYDAKPKAFSNGIRATMGVDYAKDVTSGEELVEFAVGARVFLDEDERVSLALKHARGETRQKPTFAETTTLNLEFKF